MTKSSSFLFMLFFLTTAGLLAQDQFFNKLEGRIYSQDGDVAATHVLNITSSRFTIADSQGFFEIPVKLYDTLVFSAVQFKQKEVIISLEILEQNFLLVQMEDALTQLSEVVVRLYNLSGDLSRDAGSMKTEEVVTASTLGLPNAFVKSPTQAERELYAATANPIMSVDPLINAITGRTKMLKKRVERNNTYARTERVREFYVDSLFRTDLKIPEERIDDLLYFCEVDTEFQSVVDTHDRLKIWEFIRKKSLIYRENNEMD